ncbi:SDR family oxidoreductase [Marinobacter daepoensis]|uniref:SDR family oxidoreductase n=2 Tax=Marinobacter daepoensis TaxID=262077 RepID=A0ABS3BAI4_9GAMM|nr:SDR family oxidoreductase [Marinobacter daepoensis]MBY6080626.1 SDR family oxidoreductase [Marinobacter daepoensis]
MNKERIMTILITGATGFIGKHLCLTLLQQGCQVQALTRSPASLTQLTGFLEHHGAPMQHFSVLEGDLDKAGLGLAALPNDIECLVHLAARFAWHLPRHTARATNVEGSLRVAELASQLGCRLVFISGFMLANTGYLSGLGINPDHSSHTNWDRVYRRTGGYEASKLESAFALRAYATQHRLKTVEVQPATVAGHSETGELEAGQPLYGLLDNLAHGRLAMIPGSAGHWLPLIPVDTLARAIAAACTDDNPPDTLLVLDRTTPNLKGLLQEAATALGTTAPRRHLPMGIMKALLSIPGLPGLLNVARESLDFIQTCRFDTSGTDLFLRLHGIEIPPFGRSLRASGQRYRLTLNPAPQAPRRN